MTHAAAMDAPQRPRTLWPSRERNPSDNGDARANRVADTGLQARRPREHRVEEHSEIASPPSQPPACCAPLDTPGPQARNPTVSMTDPWERYEPRARVKGSFEVILARHRMAKNRLVAVQSMGSLDPAIAIAQIQRNRHRSFPELVDHLAHGAEAFLVWEPWEASVADVLASSCDVTDPEIAEIIWPVLSGIAFLRKQGLALACLTESHVLLLAQGSVKIAGAEHCQPVSPLERDPARWQLSALSAMAARLLAKHTPRPPRDADLRQLPSHLLQHSVDDLIRDAGFACMSGHGELAALAKVANMTAFRNVEFL